MFVNKCGGKEQVYNSNTLQRILRPFDAMKRGNMIK